jgi:cbb3-type cytochrome oxidase subunit 3
LSLLAFTVGFLGLVIWAYSPSRKRRLQKYGSIPLDDEAESETNESTKPPEENSRG